MFEEMGDAIGASSVNAPVTTKANKPSFSAPAGNTSAQIPDDDRAVAAIQKLLPEPVPDGKQSLEGNVSEANSAIKTFDQAKSLAKSSIEGILDLYYESIEERLGLLIDTKKLLKTMSREIIQIKEKNFRGYFLGVSERIENVDTLMEFQVKDVVGKEIRNPFAQSDMQIELLDVVGQKAGNIMAEIAEEITADTRRNIEAEADTSLEAQANIIPEADADLHVLEDTV